MKIEVNGSVRKLKIDLEPGVYVFDNESGIGKTFLGKTLQSMSNIGMFKAAYLTYDATKCEDIIKAKLGTDKFDIIFFDRLDLYINDEIRKLIKSLSETAVVLLDVKSLRAYSTLDYKFAYIKLEKNLLEVSNVLCIWGLSAC